MKYTDIAFENIASFNGVISSSLSALHFYKYSETCL